MDANPDWGTLGQPMDPPASAQLLHLVHTEIAILRHARYETGASVPVHRHDCASLVYGVGGPCLEFAALSQVIRRRLTFLPAHHEHSLEYRGTTHVLAIEIAPEWLARTCNGNVPAEMIALPATLYDRIWRVLIDVASGAPEAALSASLGQLVRDSTEYLRTLPSPLVIRLIDDVHQHWKNVPSVSQLARKYGLSKQYLCRVFRKTMGITLQQYGLLVRLDHARGMLWSTDLPIAEVAAETGFADQSHLTRALSAHSAWSPLRLRWLAPCLNKVSLVPLTPSRYDHVAGGQPSCGGMLVNDVSWSGHSVSATSRAT
jgi:AraC-like DNA-binding protein